MIKYKNMPEWLYDFIYNDLGGCYCPDKAAFQNNLFSDEEKNLKYLGTYFPRSFSESYCIFYNLFDNAAYVETIKDRDSFSILTFGCGTGGDLMGLLEAIAVKLPWIKNIEVTAYDGNFNAIAMMKKIVDHPNIQGRFHIHSDYAPVPMENSEDFGLFCSVIDKYFDFIMSFKMVNELYRHNILPTKPYQCFLEALTPKLTGTGVMLLLDVPLKEKDVNLPLLLTYGMREFLRSHSEFEAMVPVPCHVKSRDCKERCYLRTVFYGDVFSSERVSYCMLSRTDMAKRVCNGIRDGSCYVVNDDGECCKKTSGVTERDVFDLKIK